MTRLLGALCILGGGLTLRGVVLRERRTTLETLDGLLDALDRMGTAIRLRRTPLPELLWELEALNAFQAALFFHRLRLRAETGSLSPETWVQAANQLPIPALCQDRMGKLGQALRGDELAALRALEAVSDSLQTERQRLRDTQKQDNQRTGVCTVSAALLLIILLS